jgi:sulfide:quinone oxidoreductase
MPEYHPPALPHRVVIAGGGVAGLEALIALQQLAGDLVSVTLLAPADEFLLRALSVESPFARPAPRRYDLARACTDHGASFHRDALHAVHREECSVTTQGGDELPYDSLLVAIGARPSPAFDQALTFGGLQDAEAMHGLIQDVELGHVSRIAFVVPSGTTWALPLYELALMTAERADSLGMAVQLTIVTPESDPLAIFGREASARVDDILAERGIVVRTNCHVGAVEGGTVFAGPGAVEVRAQRVVALPRLNGPRIEGLPVDDHGFLPVDEYGRVRGVEHVYGAGDGTDNPIKQGGIAAQQAGTAAQSIARAAGADVVPRPFRPVLRAELLTGSASTYLREHVAGGAGGQSSVASDHVLWWPPTKVAAPHLAPYLSALDAGEAEPPPSAPHALHAQGDPTGGIEVI